MICRFKLSMYIILISNLPHFLKLFNYLVVRLHYFLLFYYHFCNKICTHSIYSIKIYKEANGLLFSEINL